MTNRKEKEKVAQKAAAEKEMEKRRGAEEELLL